MQLISALRAGEPEQRHALPRGGPESLCGIGRELMMVIGQRWPPDDDGVPCAVCLLRAPARRRWWARIWT
jgi:hypothetical protein